MIFRIPKGRHRAWPLQFRLWWDRKVFTWHIMFHSSCRYDLKSSDQLDVNKLIGIGYLPGHHTDSARFGWRYDGSKGKIEVSAYCYVNGRREYQFIGYVEIGKNYRLQLNVTKQFYVFVVYDVDADKSVSACSIPHHHSKKLQCRLGIFFGGNRPAPHDMKIQIEK